jgi:hypothetical protein
VHNVPGNPRDRANKLIFDFNRLLALRGADGLSNEISERGEFLFNKARLAEMEHLATTNKPALCVAVEYPEQRPAEFNMSKLVPAAQDRRTLQPQRVSIQQALPAAGWRAQRAANQISHHRRRAAH